MGCGLLAVSWLDLESVMVQTGGLEYQTIIRFTPNKVIFLIQLFATQMRLVN